MHGQNKIALLFLLVAGVVFYLYTTRRRISKQRMLSNEPDYIDQDTKDVKQEEEKEEETIIVEPNDQTIVVNRDIYDNGYLVEEPNDFIYPAEFIYPEFTDDAYIPWIPIGNFHTWDGYSRPNYNYGERYWHNRNRWNHNNHNSGSSVTSTPTSIIAPYTGENASARVLTTTTPTSNYINSHSGSYRSDSPSALLEDSPKGPSSKNRNTLNYPHPARYSYASNPTGSDSSSTWRSSSRWTDTPSSSPSVLPVEQTGRWTDTGTWSSGRDSNSSSWRSNPNHSLSSDGGQSWHGNSNRSSSYSGGGRSSSYSGGERSSSYSGGGRRSGGSGRSGGGSRSSR